MTPEERSGIESQGQSAKGAPKTDQQGQEPRKQRYRTRLSIMLPSTDGDVFALSVLTALVLVGLWILVGFLLSAAS